MGIYKKDLYLVILDLFMHYPKGSSLREHHLIYFNHILELFKPYLSKDFILKEKKKFLQIREQIKYIVQLVLPHYL